MIGEAKEAKKGEDFHLFVPRHTSQRNIRDMLCTQCKDLRVLEIEKSTDEFLRPMTDVR
jgi:hypothetical protein